IAYRPAIIDAHIVADAPTQLLQPLGKRRDPARRFRIVCGEGHERADASPAAALLRPSRKRPCGSRTAKQRDELAPFHSITSSARASSVGAMLIPRALAVVRLMMRSNLVGCSTGMSAGFAPRKILSTNSPARRNRSV